MSSSTNKNIWGIIFSLIGLVILLAIVNSGNNTPIIQWPTEGFHNLAFSIGWLSPFPDAVAYILAILTIVLVMWIFYKLGQWLYGKLLG